MEHSHLQHVTRAVRRAEVPYILFPDDAAACLRLEVDEAREALRQGRLGPWFTVNGEPAVLREALRAHIGILTSQREGKHKEMLRRRS